MNHFSPMSFQTRKSFVRLRSTIEDILDENRDACDCLIDCIVGLLLSNILVIEYSTENSID